MKKIVLLSLVGSLAIASTLQEIKSSGNIRIGVRNNLAPFSNKNNNDDYAGFEIELAKKIGKAIVGNNGTITFIEITPSNRIEYLENNKVDIVFGSMTKTKEREKRIDFSIPYLSGTLSAITRKSDNIKTKEDLKDRKILVLKHTSAEEFIDSHSLGEKVYCTNNLDCLEKIQNKEGDAYIRSNTLIAQLVLLDENIERSIKSLGPISYICAGIAKENNELRKFVDMQILELSKNGFFKKAYSDTFEPFFKGTIDKKYILLDDLYSTMF